MTHFEAWKMTWGLDPLAWFAFADWLEEGRQFTPTCSGSASSSIPEIRAAQEGSACWRRRGEVARAVLAWIEKYQKTITGYPDADYIWMPPKICWGSPWHWLYCSLKTRTLRLTLWQRRMTPVGWTESPTRPDLVFPLNKLSDQAYLRKRLIALADRIGNLIDADNKSG